jgi:hypothetical protein
MLEDKNSELTQIIVLVCHQPLVMPDVIFALVAVTSELHRREWSVAVVRHGK